MKFRWLFGDIFQPKTVKMESKNIPFSVIKIPFILQRFATIGRDFDSLNSALLTRRKMLL